MSVAAGTAFHYPLVAFSLQRVLHRHPRAGRAVAFSLKADRGGSFIAVVIHRGYVHIHSQQVRALGKVCIDALPYRVVVVDIFLAAAQQRHNQADSKGRQLYTFHALNYISRRRDTMVKSAYTQGPLPQHRMKPRFLQTDNLLNLLSGVAIAVLLGTLIWHTVSMLLPSLHIPWFASSDESILLSEVIRFSGGNFYQSFFDMPGTPLMMLGAAEWRIYYATIALMHGSIAEINLFTFQHLQQLFTLMRINSLIFFVISALLLFRIVSKATNKYAGAGAATLLLMNHGYEATVPFVRAEPLATCFMLAAIIVLTECNPPLGTLGAGLLCGIGAACRLHSITASLPILILLLVFRGWKSAHDYSRGFARLVACLAAGALLVSMWSFYFFALAPTPWARTFPHAYALFAQASLAAALSIVVLAAGYWVPKTRPLVWKIVTPGLVQLLAGAAFGVLLGVPTAFLRIDAFLESVDFYEASQYLDPVAAHLPFIQKWTSLFHTYLPVIFPDKTVAMLFVAAACLTLTVPRLRRLAPYLIVALAFFISRPLGLVRAPHHVALWIPFYAAVSAIPFAVVANFLSSVQARAR